MDPISIDEEIQVLSERVRRLLLLVEKPARSDNDEWAAERRAVAEGFQKLAAIITRSSQKLKEAQAQGRAADAALIEHRRLLTEGPDGYLITDAAGMIREANAAIAEMLQVPRRFLVGKPFSAFVVQTDIRAFRWRLNNIASQRTGEWPLRLRPRHADPFIAGVTVAALDSRPGAPPDLRWFVRDISVRQRAEEFQAAYEFTREILGAEQHARTETERARQRLELLARVSGILATSIQSPGALGDVA
ncbi:MAG TPA: PAS domain-containing protein, partial [Candidatus Eisenbacteria bacterium]|nr:PAS domain-containing protein [Candidatus Eisenbacteria bacterium]